MVTVSAFADEISADLKEQLDVLDAEGIKHIEFRSVWNKNVLDLSDDELRRVREALDGRGFRISAVGSPIGKISIIDDFAPTSQNLSGRWTSPNTWVPNAFASFHFSSQRVTTPATTATKSCAA
ncbi:hypothetical protein [Alicyclobacillus fastidiosus]|uniref:hypothetical protein n=1 Tax=Alicyclobacillus fastidiosus TaxID=392011 RepID=UPI0023E9C8A3|nr:hypothetical protein [Alicyclobacillus fastidiosus]GMA65003.1 hypothetical protein GCM10025859_54430 [Alicyclobacillus fastidiosus]